MSRKSRVRGAVWGMVITALFCFIVAIWMLTKPSIIMQAAAKYNPNPNYVPHMVFEDIPAYALLSIAVVCLALIPVAISQANKRADADDEKAEMKAMLEDYRQRKKQNRP